MFGAELIEFVAFGKQVGMVLAGAAALWGLVFLRIRRQVAQKLLLPLFGGAAVAAGFWLWLSGTIVVSAHEGIVLEPARADIIAALELLFPVFAVWAGGTLAGFLWWLVKRESFLGHIGWFYAAEFLLAAVLVSFTVWTGEWSRAQFFFVGHSVHSIFTLGTVLILDFLFLISKGSPILKQYVYPKFPFMSKVIWIGLTFDFLSVALVFREAIDLTPKFFFMQTVIGILIVNGVVLAGPITRRMISSVKEGGVVLGKRWLLAAEIAGTISVVSWFSITFVDFFAHLTLEYFHFLGLYAAFLSILFAGHFAWETWGKLSFNRKQGMVQ